jgi:4-amino-4-deoxy-L-arabinose transferase-like glycosyltransferase
VFHQCVTLAFLRRLLPFVCALAVVTLTALVLAAHYVPAFDGTDENGYILSAKRLATQGNLAKHARDPFEFVSPNWVQTDEGEFHAKYPVGYPLLCAAAYRSGGPAATFLVNPLLALLTILGVFLLGRAMVDDFAGLLAAVLMAFNPMHLHFGLSALSHTGSVCFAVWGMYFLWRWTQHGGWHNAALTGAFCAYAISIRYTEGLLALPVLAMIAWRGAGEWRTARGPWAGQVGVMTLAAVAALGPLFAQHWAAYGSIFSTGYGLCGESTGFGWKWFVVNWRNMLTRLDTGGLYLVFPIGVAGLVWLAGHDYRRGLFLGLWTVPPILVYTAYYWAPEGQGVGYLRFFLSIFPSLILSALAVVCRPGKLRAPGVVLLGAFVLLVSFVNSREALPQLERAQQKLLFARATSDLARQRVPTNALVLASSRILNFLEFAGDWRLYSQDFFEKSSVGRRTQVLKHDEPNPFHRRKAERMHALVGNRTDLQLADLQREVLLKAITNGLPVMALAPDSSLAVIRGRLSARLVLRPVARWNEAAAGWTLYELEPRAPGDKPERPLTLEERIEQLQFEAKTRRAEFAEKYPDAKKEWDGIADVERRLQALQEQLRQRQPKPRAPTKGRD